METMELHDKLIDIQQKLKAPKNQFNKFGNYYYRNCEDILEAVKPLLKDHGLTLLLGDSVVEVGNRVYIKSTASLGDGTKQIEVYGWARESEAKKGMDDSQITGSTSSYARKYALNGLFLIDDTKDSDSQDNRPRLDEPKATSNKPTPRSVGESASDKQKQLIKTLLERKGVAKEDMTGVLEVDYGIIPGSQMTKDDAKNIIKDLMETK